MPDKKIGLLYFGRLDDEKGFGLILDILEQFISKYGELPFSFYVFGKGKYVPQLLELAENNSSIHFFGRQSLDTIKRYKDNCNYCLMPSTFLETFGLTALNSLSMGLPVIGFSKGGLKQFIPAKYDINKSKGSDSSQKLFNTIEQLINLHKQNKLDSNKEKNWSIKLSQKYTIQEWLKNTKELIGKPKRILLVSDFKSRLGGIETYIHDVKDILVENGYEVKIYGSKIPHGKFGVFAKYFGLFFATWNFVDAIRLSIVVRKFKPKVVWYHSTLRWLGWLPIKLLSKHKSKKLMMYHDLGYFHPFPHSVFEDNAVLTPMSLGNYLKSSNTKNPIKILAICFKYLSVCLLKRQLKKSIDKHLVPSQFVEEILIKSYKVKPKKVQTLSHFIQK